MRTLTNTIALGVAAVLLAGCGGKIQYPTYYTIDAPPIPANQSTPTHFAGTLAVRRFESAPYIRQKRIIYRPLPEEIGFYEYHQWAMDPGEMVTTAMIEALRSSHLFSQVKPYDGQNQQDYIMSGRLERLEETDYGGAVRVMAQLSAELVNLRTGTTEWTGDEAETLNVDERNINSVVIELNHAVHKSIDRLVVSLDQQALTK